MFFIRRKRHLAEMSTKELLRRAHQLGWSAAKSCGAYVVTNRFHGNAVASAPMTEEALRRLLTDLIRGRYEAPM